MAGTTHNMLTPWSAKTRPSPPLHPFAISKSLPLNKYHPEKMQKSQKVPSDVATPSTTTAPLIPDKVLPNLYISDIITARAVLSPNYPAPNRPKIRYILSILNKEDKVPKVAEGLEANFVLKFIKLPDDDHEDLLAQLKDACDFIRMGMKAGDGSILVHCQKGVSRSAAVVIAYAMEEMDLDYDTAFRYVRSSRGKIQPNPGFVKQLIMWRNMKWTLYNEDGSEKAEYIKWKATLHVKMPK